MNGFVTNPATDQDLFFLINLKSGFDTKFAFEEQILDLKFKSDFTNPENLKSKSELLKSKSEVLKSKNLKSKHENLKSWI